MERKSVKRQYVKSKTKQLAVCAMFVALMTVSAFIKIPTPILPVTLQVAVCVACGLMLGAKLAVVSVGTYVAMGLVGLPVFTAGGGFGYVVKPSFGYILGFVVAAFVVGALADNLKRREKYTFLRLLPCALAGMLCIHVIGSVYMYFILNYISGTPITIWKAALTGSIMFLPSDTLWCVIGCFCAVGVRRVVDKIIA